MFTMASTFGWKVQQINVIDAFLNGILPETVYMTQPSGFVDSHKLVHVCLLKTANRCSLVAIVQCFVSAI